VTTEEVEAPPVPPAPDTGETAPTQ
jgi:hypothetical protein